MDEKIESEGELKKWFMTNYQKLGYSKIVRKDIGIFPDFIMLKNNREIRVELETLSSNFILHNHNVKKVDEIVCIKHNSGLNVPVIIASGLTYVPRLRRVSATIGPDTKKLLGHLIKNGKYRNKSHVIEKAIELLWEDENDKNKK